MEKKKLILLCGIPASGKSTLANILSEELQLPIISRDEIRFSLLSENDDYFAKEELVFQTFYKNINLALKETGGAIVDATHITQASRNKILDKIKDIENVDIYIKAFDVLFEQCLLRNSTREGLRKVPRQAMYFQNLRYEIPTYKEKYSYKNIEIIK